MKDSRLTDTGNIRLRNLATIVLGTSVGCVHDFAFVYTSGFNT